MKPFYTILLSVFLPVAVFSQSTTTPPLFEGSAPSFSSDGKKIAYSDSNNIWIYELSTKKKQKVTNLMNCTNPKFSPDGKAIAFQSYGKPSPNNLSFSIWTINVNGSNLNKLYKEDGSDQYPFWSPDGTKIAWTHGKQLWIADKDGKNAKPLTKEAAKEYEFITDWPKNSNTILYARQDSYDREGYSLFLVDTDGNNQKKIGSLNNVIFAKFTADNKGIYINQGENQIKRFDLSTEKLENLFKIKNENETRSFNFSPDFKLLTFDNSGPGTTPKVFIMKLQ